MESKNEKKTPKTWEEAIKELPAFIIKSKEEEKKEAKENQSSQKL